MRSLYPKADKAFQNTETSDGGLGSRIPILRRRDNTRANDHSHLNLHNLAVIRMRRWIENGGIINT